MSPAEPIASTDLRRLVVVAGSGRSGTSSVAGVLQHLGLVIPPPQVEGNRSNPRGFFEPRWVVDFQSQLLRRSEVRLTDARPEAVAATVAVGSEPTVQRQLGAWLSSRLEVAPELVIKDPRNSWFLPMWREVAHTTGAVPGFLTMLRHPAEVVGSKAEYYKNKGAGRGRRQVQITRVAGWLNICLSTEELTRGSRRVFLRYTDLLDDWRPPVQVAAKALDLSLRTGWDEARTAAVDAFLDPDLHRVHTGWDDIDVPTELRDLAERAWGLLNVLVDAGGHDAAAQAGLDDIRTRYASMYADAEALVQSTIDAPAPPKVPGPQQQEAAPDPPVVPAPAVVPVVPVAPVAPARRVVSAVRRRLRASTRR